MTEIALETHGAESYSRRAAKRGRRRRSARRDEEFRDDFKATLPPTKMWPALVWSLVVSFLSVANPFLTSLATNEQSQSFYAGMAMRMGEIPYGHFFGTSGYLYYVLAWLGTSFGTTIGFAVLEFLALLIAGIYFYKLVAYFSKGASGTQLTTWFYLFLLALAFGGLYASLFALPFVLASLWFLVRYVENAAKDEGFILYGVAAAVVFLLDTRSALLWLVGSWVLLIFNIAHKRWARGFYQLLASLFGFLIVMYSVGYYALVKQILGSAIQQTFLYYLEWHPTQQQLMWTGIMAGIVLIVSGFLKNSFQTMASLRFPEHRAIKWVVLLTFLTQLIFIVGPAAADVSQFVVLLPYGLLMAVLPLHQETEVAEEDEEREEPQSLDYLKAQFFLPLLACLYIPVQPLLTYVQNGTMEQERETVATYIREHSEKEATIYAWDDSAQIYLDSQRLAASKIITAEPYLDTEASQKQLVYDLKQKQAQFIVVNTALLLHDTVKDLVAQSYQVVDTGSQHLQVYQKKE